MTGLEQTLVLIKPDAVARGLVGDIIARYESKGLKIVQMELRLIGRDFACMHYQEHHDRPFFDDLVNFITSAPLVAMVLEGERAIQVVRTLHGDTDSALASPGTIRGDFSCSKNMNIVHASDSAESAQREIELWFGERA